MKIFTQLLFAIVFTSLAAGAAGGGEGEHRAEFYPKKQPNKVLSSRPAQPVLMEPKALSVVTGNQVTLKWQAVENADSYRVQVATDGNFKWLVTQQDFYKDTSFNVTGLESGKTYFWRIYALNPKNEAGFSSSFSTFSSFKVK